MMSPKDPAEIVTVTFDFSGLATAISSPQLTCAIDSGRVHDNVQSMLFGVAQIDGLVVRQRVIGGLHGNTYKLRCAVDDADGEHWVVADILTVKSA